MSKDQKDIIEIKPGAYGVYIDLRALWRKLNNKPKNDSVLPVAERFLKIFQDHGVAVSQIPRLIPLVDLERLRSTEALLPALTPQVIQQVSELFGIKRAWLEGTTEEMYELRWCYKSPERFFAELATLDLKSVTYPVIAFCCDEFLNGKSRRKQPFVLVMVEKCADINDKEIRRYRINRDDMIWNYKKCRIQVKAMIRIVERLLNRPIPLYRVSREKLQLIEDGLIVPKSGCRLHDVSLEDYSLSPDESAVSKEAEELPEVLKYLEMTGLINVIDRYESLKVVWDESSKFYMTYRIPAPTSFPSARSDS